MRIFTSILILIVLFTSCKTDQSTKNIGKSTSQWVYDSTIKLDGINPIGIAIYGNTFILSDGDHNRIVYVSEQGELLREIADYERPMHIDYGKGNNGMQLLVPEYGRDSIAIMTGKKRDYIRFKDSLDAPGAASISGNMIAIADFYNNRILVKNGDEEFSFGKEGKNDGEFYYPTDVQIKEDRIYVADAYNNRGQVFDLNGKFIAKFAQNDSLNAATGIFKSEKNIFLTDFENDRILVYNNDYQKLQSLKEAVHKPTDVITVGDSLLYVTNYRKGQIVKYVKN
ncbi:MAG: NHL repeat-containing protein [Nonlabens sp.]